MVRSKIFAKKRRPPDDNSSSYAETAISSAETAPLALAGASASSSISTSTRQQQGQAKRAIEEPASGKFASQPGNGPPIHYETPSALLRTGTWLKPFLLEEHREEKLTASSSTGGEGAVQIQNKCLGKVLTEVADSRTANMAREFAAKSVVVRKDKRARQYREQLVAREPSKELLLRPQPAPGMVDSRMREDDDSPTKGLFNDLDPPSADTKASLVRQGWSFKGPFGKLSQGYAIYDRSTARNDLRRYKLATWILQDVARKNCAIALKMSMGDPRVVSMVISKEIDAVQCGVSEMRAAKWNNALLTFCFGRSPDGSWSAPAGAGTASCSSGTAKRSSRRNLEYGPELFVPVLPTLEKKKFGNVMAAQAALDTFQPLVNSCPCIPKGVKTEEDESLLPPRVRKFIQILTVPIFQVFFDRGMRKCARILVGVWHILRRQRLALLRIAFCLLHPLQTELEGALETGATTRGVSP